MSRIVALHGVVDRVDPRRFAFRNLSSAAALDAFLSAANAPFVPLADALAGRGEALTIDDATRAAADAALLARARGHAVTVFVNPGQVESGAPYAFVMLNTLLDALPGRPCEFEGQRFAASTTAQRQVLRRAVKARLQATADERARLELVTTLAARWSVDRLDVPPHFATLSKRDLVTLRDAGVDVQNHGWVHSYHPSLSAQESAREVREGRAWLARELDLDARYFAVPFGEGFPLPGAADACDVWFTLLPEPAPRPYPPKVVDRDTPEVPERTARGRVGAWAARVRAFARRF